MRRRPPGTSVALAVVALACGGALAEERLEPPDLERYLRWGPLRVRPGFELTQLGYDDNIFFDDASRASDLTATVSPRVDGLLLLGNSAFLEFRQRFDYRAYRDFSDLNYLDSRTRARLTFPFRSFGLFVQGDRTRLHQRPQDRFDLRPLQVGSRFLGGVIVRPNWRTEIEIAATADRYTHEDEDAVLNGRSVGERLDRRADGMRIEGGYRIGGRTRLLLQTRTQDVRFDDDFVLAGMPVDRDTRDRRWLVGAAFDEGGRLSGSILVGRGRIDAVAPELPDLDEVIGELQLVHRLGRSTRLTIDGERTPGFAVFGANSYYLDTRAEVRATHYLDRLFGLEAAVSRGELTFPESGGVGREDTIDRYEAGLLFRLSENSLGRQVVYRLTFGRYRRDSTVDAFDQEQNTVGIGARVGF